MWWIPYGVTPSIDCKLFEDTDHYTPKVLYNAQGLKKQFFNLGFSTGVTLLTQGHLATSGDICGCPNWHLEDRDQGYLVLNLLQWAEQHPHQELSGLQSQERPHWEPRANGWTYWRTTDAQAQTSLKQFPNTALPFSQSHSCKCRSQRGMEVLWQRSFLYLKRAFYPMNSSICFFHCQGLFCLVILAIIF